MVQLDGEAKNEKSLEANSKPTDIVLSEDEENGSLDSTSKPKSSPSKDPIIEVLPYWKEALKSHLLVITCSFSKTSVVCFLVLDSGRQFSLQLQCLSLVMKVACPHS